MLACVFGSVPGQFQIVALHRDAVRDHQIRCRIGVQQLIGENHRAGGRHGVIQIEARFARADRIVDLVYVGLFGLQSRALDRHAARRIYRNADRSLGLRRNVEADRTVHRIVVGDAGIAHVQQPLADGHFLVARLQHDEVLRLFGGTRLCWWRRTPESERQWTACRAAPFCCIARREKPLESVAGPDASLLSKLNLPCASVLVVPSVCMPACVGWISMTTVFGSG